MVLGHDPVVAGRLKEVTLEFRQKRNCVSIQHSNGRKYPPPKHAHSYGPYSGTSTQTTQPLMRWEDEHPHPKSQRKEELRKALRRIEAGGDQADAEIVGQEDKVISMASSRGR